MKINISGFIYDVIETIDDLAIEVSPDNEPNERLIGLVDYSSLRIYVRKDSAPQMRVSTMWHEAVHAWLEQAGYINQDEAFVETMGFCIAALVSANPELVNKTNYFMNTDRLTIEDREYYEANQVVSSSDEVYQEFDLSRGVFREKRPESSSFIVNTDSITYPDHIETNKYEYDAMGRIIASIKTISYDKPDKE